MAIVYRHRRLDTNKIFYIGVGVDEKRAFTKRSRNIFWNNIINKTDYSVEIIQKNLSQEEAFELEIFLIELYGRKDINTGILCNLTDGGDGRRNIIVNLETRMKISVTNTNKNHNPIIRGTKKKETRNKYVLDTSTGKVYNTIIDACNIANISLRHFKRCLYGERANYTGFELVDEKQKYKCRKK
jgi:hypothetical protein